MATVWTVATLAKVVCYAGRMQKLGLVVCSLLFVVGCSSSSGHIADSGYSPDLAATVQPRSARTVEAATGVADTPLSRGEVFVVGDTWMVADSPAGAGDDGADSRLNPDQTVVPADDAPSVSNDAPSAKQWSATPDPMPAPTFRGTLRSKQTRRRCGRARSRFN